jgi:hypothetical protein
MSLKCCRMDNVLCFPFGGKQNNAVTGICKHLGARTHTRDFQLQHVFAQPPFCTTFPQFNYLPRPPILPRLLSDNTSLPLHPTANSHGYYAVADYSSAVILSTGLCARSPENDEKGQKGKTIVGPHIPYGIFQTKGELCAKFGSDWFRNVNLYKVQTHTHTDTQTNIQLYINYEE